MDAAPSTPPVTPEVEPKDEKKAFLDSMLQNRPGSSKNLTKPSTASDTQKACVEAEVKIVQEHMKGETVDDIQSQNSLRYSEDVFSRNSISSDVDNETYYSLESDHEKAVSPDSLDDGEEYDDVHDQRDVEDSQTEFPRELFVQRDTATSHSFGGDQPGDFSHDDTLIGSSSSAESLSGWEEVHQLPPNILMSKTVHMATGPTHHNEIAQADEGTLEWEMDVFSNSDSEPVDLSTKNTRLYLPSAQVDEISSSQDHQLSEYTEHNKHHLSPNIDSGDSEEEPAKLDGKRLVDEIPKDNFVDSEAQQLNGMSESENQEITTHGETGPISTPNEALSVDPEPEEFTLYIYEQDVPSDEEVIKEVQSMKDCTSESNLETTFMTPRHHAVGSASFFEVTNVAATSGGVCQAQELMAQTGYSQEGIASLLDVSPEPLKNEEQKNVKTDVAQTACRDEAEEALQQAADPATENAQPDLADAITEKSASKRVSFSSLKSQKGIFHTKPTFPITELHKWPADLSLKRKTPGAGEIQIEEEGLPHSDGGIRSSNESELAPGWSMVKREKKTDEGIELSRLSSALTDTTDQLTGNSNARDVKGVENPTFVMDDSTTEENQVEEPNEETPSGKSSTMRSLIKETYLPRLKPNDHLLMLYPDRLQSEATADGKNAKVEESPDHIAIRLHDDQDGTGSTQTAPEKVPVSWWMSEYFGCSCILFLIIMVIIFCVVLRTYFPSHYVR